MLQAAIDHYARQQRLAAVTVAGARRAWRRLDVRDLDGSWRPVAAQLLVLVGAAQRAAAHDGAAYVPEALEEQGIDADPAGDVLPGGFVGVASDGRRLDTLLYSPVTAVKAAIGAGQSAEQAMGSGLFSLETIVATQVQDAARQAVGIGIAARPKVTGYVRMLNPPSCSRCAVLAGRVYRWNAGFLRHPRCDCRHVPTVENVAGDLTTSPRGFFDSLTPAEQNRVFTGAGAQAIRDGADIGQVVNARRGMTAAGTTTEAAGRRVRLMPERIYQQAASRDDAIRLLRANGYLN